MGEQFLIYLAKVSMVFFGIFIMAIGAVMLDDDYSMDIRIYGVVTFIIGLAILITGIICKL